MSSPNLYPPLTLEIFFHIYTTPSPLPRWESRETKDTLAWLLDNELVTRSNSLQIARVCGENIYKLTEKGHVWKHAILSVPLPIKQWIIPTGENK